MNLRNIIDNYIEVNNFEIKYINNKIKVYYYDEIDNFTSNNIVIKYKDKKINIKGKNLAIETMFKEYLIIGGNIKLIEFND